MRLFRELLGTSLLLLAIPCAAASNPLDDAFLLLIKKDFSPSCSVVRTSVGTSTIGNNGLVEEQWFMQTCVGPREYWVSYYPPASFPRRASPYQVVRHTTNVAAPGRAP